MGRTGIALSGVIGLLLALNVGVFLAGMAMQNWSPAARAPLVFNAEKIRLLAVPSGADVRRAVASQSETPASVAAPVEAGPKGAMRCLSWSSMDAAGLAAIEARLKQLGIAANRYDIELEKALGWWVYLPPAANDAALQASIEEVRRLGITDYAPVRSGSLRNALSLGALGNLAQARAHAARLTDKGVKGVKFGPRPESGVARLVFTAALADADLPNPDTVWPDGLRPERCELR